MVGYAFTDFGVELLKSEFKLNILLNFTVRYVSLI